VKYRLKQSGSWKLAALGSILSLLVVGCSTPGDDLQFKKDIEILGFEDEKVRSASREVGVPLQPSTVASRNRAEYIDGTGEFSKNIDPIKYVKEDQQGAVSLTFKSTDIRIVLRAVLADTLKLSYTVDPRVQGQVTLETSGPIGKEALQLILESLLKTKGYAMVAVAGGYHILPVAEAPRNVTNIRQGLPASVDLPGFGVQVVRLDYTLPSDMEKLMAPFAPDAGVLRADDARQILILAGTTQEMAAMLRAIETFDVDSMTGKSFGIYNLNYVEADVIVDELKAIFGGDQENRTPVEFIPVPRINRLIAISAKRDILRSIEQWIEKLDLGESSPGRRIYVYQVKNSRAADVSETLNLILGSRNGASGRFGQNQTSNTTRNSQGRSAGISGNNNRTQERSGSNYSGLNAYGQSNGEEGIRIVPSEENNSLLIMATPSEFGVVETALKQLDVPPRQVLIEVTLAEIGLTDELRFGLQWQFGFDDNSVAFGKSNSPSPEFPGFSWVYSKGNTSAVLNALETYTDVKVVSSPRILVLNNQSATIQVGDEVPVPTSSAQSTSDSNAPIINTIQYRNTGVILTVTPRINDGGLVMLDVEQELSNVVETASSGIDAPTIQQRKITSSIAVQNGSTIALGGLIRNTVSKTNSGVPILKDIPLIGNLFKNSNFVERRTELVILLTPRIIRDVEETRSVMDELRKDFRSLMKPQESAE